MADLQKGDSNPNSILLVSGGGKRLKQFETVQVLHDLHQRRQSDSGIRQLPVYCAYNPYLSGEAAEEEHTRLHSKLLAGVCGVYLQIGEQGPQVLSGEHGML
jgi:hypothetical protein